MNKCKYLLSMLLAIVAGTTVRGATLTLPFMVDGKKTFEQGEAVNVYHYGQGYTAYELTGIARSGSVYWIPSQKRLLFDNVTIDKIKRNELVASSSSDDVLIWLNGKNTITCNTFVYSCGQVSIAGDSDMASKLVLNCKYPIVANGRAYVAFLEWHNVYAETLVSSAYGTKMEVCFETVKGVLRADDHLFPNADALMMTRCGLKVSNFDVSAKNVLVYDRREGKIKMYNKEQNTLVLTYEDDYYDLDSSDKKAYVYDLYAQGVTKGTKTLEQEAAAAHSNPSSTAATGPGSTTNKSTGRSTGGKTTAVRSPTTAGTSGTRRTTSSTRRTK